MFWIVSSEVERMTEVIVDVAVADIPTAKTCRVFFLDSEGRALDKAVGYYKINSDS